MGHFLVAHRGYISLFNLKDATDELQEAMPDVAATPGGPTETQNQASLKKSLWVQHLKIDKDQHFIRELFLQRREHTFYDFETSSMRCHSKPVMSLEKLYVFGVLIGRNCIRRLHLHNGRLSLMDSECDRQVKQQFEDELKGKIVIGHYNDQKYSSGILIKVVAEND